jgi:hypothetical protein
MALGWKDWKLSDILYGIVIPVIVVLVIIVLSQVGSLFEGGSYGVLTGIVIEIEEMVIIVGVPLLLGLVWNRWAGGASGFLLGSIFAMWFFVKYSTYFGGSIFMGFGPFVLGYLLSAMLIGYMAGALNQHSDNFKRMVISGVISTTVGGLLLFGVFQLSPSNVTTGVWGLLLTVLPRTACGVIIPVIAKFFMWYGVTMHKKPNA